MPEFHYHLINMVANQHLMHLSDYSLEAN